MTVIPHWYHDGLQSWWHQCEWCGKKEPKMMEWTDTEASIRMMGTHDFCSRKCRLFFIFQYRGKTYKEILEQPDPRPNK